jgi:hypothetical protein
VGTKNLPLRSKECRNGKLIAAFGTIFSVFKLEDAIRNLFFFSLEQGRLKILKPIEHAQKVRI